MTDKKLEPDPADRIEGPIAKKAANAPPATGRRHGLREVTTSTGLDLTGLK